MLISLAAVIGGFILLVWSADRFVIGASSIASNLGVSPLVIGLTIVGFGTSAPEILISVFSALQDIPAMGVGNAIGSNIANIGLILGTSALISPMLISSGILNREMPFLIAAMLLALILIWNLSLSALDAYFLLALLAFILVWMIYKGLKERDNGDPLQSEFNDEISTNMTLKVACLWLMVGLFILVGSSRALVWGASNIATYFGVSDLVIGLTIVAIGTSLPELAASIVSVLKKEYDIAIGNIIGSNIFNILAVMAVPGLFQTVAVDSVVLYRDIPVMFALTFVMILFAYSWKNRPGRITRTSGLLLLVCFLGYQGAVFLDS
ncbi:MAG: calcium/sodium antiporter [Gammaproteobacteria bacterium]|nr:calcium/sodium antiporter [Gammaproteobacteria bacterium]